MVRSNPRDILPDPPDELKQLSLALSARIRNVMDEEAVMSFHDFMEMALYEPGLGYYSAGLRKFGEEGDFVTAPELGEVFARCLALQLEEIGHELGDWDLLEVGAGTGALAANLLRALKPSLAPRRYVILERSADLRAVQQELLSRIDAPCPIEWIDEPPSRPWKGALLANEVIDALPVERFRLMEGQLRQLCVHGGETGFEWCDRPAPKALETQLRGQLADQLDGLPDGYRSEICPMLQPWLQGLCEQLESGVALFIDYGYPRSEYYLPERRDGTLVCHYRHRAHADPFFWPGLQDITSFVDFTAVAEAAHASGMKCAGYTSQAQFLIGAGVGELMTGMEHMPDLERLKLARELRELMLPGAMGERFQVMALTRDYDKPLAGFNELDLSGRL